MPDFAMCPTSHRRALGQSVPPCPRIDVCKRNRASGTEPGEWQTWADWRRTWKDGDPGTCEGFMHIDGAEEGA